MTAPALDAQLAPANDIPPDGEVTPGVALGLAIDLIGQRQYESARTLLDRLLDAAPDYPEAMNVLGILSNHMGERDKAVALLARAAELAPSHAGILNNYGNMLVETGDIAGAVDAYKRAVRLDRHAPDPYHNLAAILIAKNEPADAEELLRHALALDPEMGAAHKTLAVLLMGTGRKREALEHFWKAVRFLPPERVSPQLMAFAYEWNGLHEEAIETVRKWQEREPDNPEPRHIMNGLTGGVPPDRAPDAFVERVFDRFATSFDAKLASLEYHAPALVGAALARQLGEPRGDRAILDAGCGTGLCGRLVKPYAAHLTGVDLSGNMLEEAVKLGLYDRLAKDELTAFIARHPAAWDAIISADTLCYFGKIEEFAAAVRSGLRDGGALIFTVEEMFEEGEYRLAFNGRYQHAEAYVRRALEGAGLAVRAMERETLRLENLEPVRGLVVTAVKQPQAA